MKEEVKECEKFMLAQFIDVLDVLEKYKTIEDVKKDIKKRKKIYLEYIQNNEELKSILSISLLKEKIDVKIEKTKEIYNEEEKYIAYKIGLIDGLKIKNECSN